MSNPLNEIKRKLGNEFAKNYKESAPMFNARIETESKKGYFVESSQFFASNGDKLKREYCLKVIGENHVSKVAEFKNRDNALSFFSGMEFTNNGALVLDRFELQNRDSFDALVSRDYHHKLYDNGLSCLYSFELFGRFITYTEGSVVRFHCSTNDIFKSEVKQHHDFFLR